MVKNLQIYANAKYNVDKTLFHTLVNALKKELNFKISSLLVNFISAEEILKINKEYLNHNHTTDIITFNYNDSHQDLDGELFISIEDAEFYAKSYNVALNEELLRLVIHGILHLLGYDDMNDKDKKVMKKLENSLLNKYKSTLLN